MEKVIDMLKLLLILLILLLPSCANDIVSWQHNDIQHEAANKEMTKVKSSLTTLQDVRQLMYRFNYQEQKFLWNYTPDIETVFLENLSGNCIFSAVLGKWALECISIPTRLVSINNGKDYHAIAVAVDNTVFVSNTQVVLIPKGVDYKQAVYAYFNWGFNVWHEGIQKPIVEE